MFGYSRWTDVLFTTLISVWQCSPWQQRSVWQSSLHLWWHCRVELECSCWWRQTWHCCWYLPTPSGWGGWSARWTEPYQLLLPTWGLDWGHDPFQGRGYTGLRPRSKDSMGLSSLKTYVDYYTMHLNVTRLLPGCWRGHECDCSVSFPGLSCLRILICISHLLIDVNSITLPTQYCCIDNVHVYTSKEVYYQWLLAWQKRRWMSITVHTWMASSLPTNCFQMVPSNDLCHSML